MIHELKTLPKYFDSVMVRKKNFEVRKNDRNFRVGDILALNEWTSDKGYTGRSIVVAVEYILSDSEYVKEGYVIMGISPCEVSYCSGEEYIPLVTGEGAQ